MITHASKAAMCHDDLLSGFALYVGMLDAQQACRS